MTYDPQLARMAIDVSRDLAWSALPDAPVLEPRSHPHALRRRAAAGLHRLADRLEAAGQLHGQAQAS